MRATGLFNKREAGRSDGTNMPSVSEEPPTTSPAKKRRRDDDRNALQIPGIYERKLAGYGAPSEQSVFFQDSAAVFAVIQSDEPLLFAPNVDEEAPRPFQRKILPLPAAKRMRVGGGCLNSNDVHRSPLHEARQQRARQSKSPTPHGRVLQDQTDAGNRPQPVRTTSTLLLSPCHICHRRPSKRSDLDSYADCQGCGERTCFVCIRECLGWVSETAHPLDSIIDDDDELSEQEALSRSFHMDDVRDDVRDDGEAGRQSIQGETRRRGLGADDGREGWRLGGHRQMVCSRCCIEKGEEGDVVCLGCLSGMEAV